MISFTKNIFVEKSTNRKSEINTDEFTFGSANVKQRQNKSKSVAGAFKTSKVELSFTQMRNLYLVNPWVRACVDKIVNRCVNHRPIIRPVTTDSSNKDEVKKETDILNEFLMFPNTNGETMDSIRKKIHRDSLVLDAAAIEIVNSIISGTNNKKRKSFEIYSLPGDTIRPNPDARGIFPDKDAYIQIDSEMNEVARWGKDDIFYFVNNVQSDRIYGISPLETLAGSVADELNASYHNSQYFENNATPRFILMFSNAGIAAGNSTVQRFSEWWDQELKGNPHRPMFISADKGEVQFQRVSLSADEMQFYEYSRWLLSKILSVYHVPPLLIGVIDSTMGKLNSEQQVVLFKEDAIKPQLRLFSSKINTKLIFSQKAFGFKNVYIDFDLDLVDRDKQARIFERYARSGVFTINQIRHELGEFEVPWGDKPYLPLNMAKVNDDGLPIVNTGAGNVGNIESLKSVYNDYERLIKKDYWSGHPVGWEYLDRKDRIGIISKMLRNRETALSKAYSYDHGK